jgi:SAM-dependent methyltransferase
MRDEIMRQFLTVGSGMRLLEIGPGSGFTAYRLAPHILELTLMDVSEKNVAVLRENLGTIPNLRFVCADACTPGLAQHVATRFDAIYGLEVFEYLPNPGECLKNLAEMLLPGGALALEFPNYPGPKSPGITCFHRREEFDGLMRAAGFSSWEIYALRLRPFARLLYQVFHEQPLKIYRARRNRSNAQKPMKYDQTWTFQNRQKMEPKRYLLHTFWTLLMAAMRLGGDCFERRPLGGEILHHDLLVLARR